MKKGLFILTAFFFVLLINSCQKHELGYIAKDMTSNEAGIKLFYDIPASSSSTTNNITKVTYNDEFYSGVSTALGGAFPNSAGKFHLVPAGSVNMDLYRGANQDDLLYSRAFNVPKGNWAAFVYDLKQDPYLVEIPDVWETGHPIRDTLCYINFVNLLYKEDGVTPFGEITIKARRTINGVNTEWETIGTAPFKGNSGFQPVKLYRKGISIWSGTESSVDVGVFDKDGNFVKRFTSATQVDPVDYIGTGYSLAKGRCYFFHFNGRQGTSYNTQIIRMSTHNMK